MPDKQKISPEEGLKAYLRSEGVPEENIDVATMAEAKLLAAKAKVRGRPKWAARRQHKELSELKNAEVFVRRVYWDLDFNERLPGGHMMWVEAVRSNDPRVVHTVQSLINEREKSQGFAEAKALTFTKLDARGRPKKSTTQALERREARATTEHEWKPPTFPLPDGLKWPVEQYDKSREYRKPDGILQHLERVWKSIIAAESIDMPTLRAFYPSTAKGIDNFKHNNGKEPRCLPAELDIPIVQTGSGRRRKVGVPPSAAPML